MTPEAAYELGKRAAAALFDIGGHRYSPTEILEDLEASAAQEAPTRLLDVESAHAVRGAASFWSELAEEARARAAALEAAR